MAGIPAADVADLLATLAANIQHAVTDVDLEHDVAAVVSLIEIVPTSSGEFTLRVHLRDDAAVSSSTLSHWQAVTDG